MFKKSSFKGLFLGLVFTFAFMQTAYAMHIMEGFLPPVWCISWAALCSPFLFNGVKKISKLAKDNSQLTVMLAMAGAFVFILSSLKIPSVTGSSSHMTGVGFAAIMFGPAITSILGLIVLIFQAVLLAHGGVTTLGANTFSMGVAGPIVTYFLYTILLKTNIPKRFIVFTSAMLGNIVTYVVTSFQLSVAFPSEVGGFFASFAKFLGIFAVTQIPLAVVEGILTVIIINVISSYNTNIFVDLKRKELV